MASVKAAKAPKAAKTVKKSKPVKDLADDVTSAKIDNHIEEFLASGGKIQEIPLGSKRPGCHFRPSTHYPGQTPQRLIRSQFTPVISFRRPALPRRQPFRNLACKYRTTGHPRHCRQQGPLNTGLIFCVIF